MICCGPVIGQLSNFKVFVVCGVVVFLEVVCQGASRFKAMKSHFKFQISNVMKINFQ